jgi:tight adherence protein B
MSLFLIAIFVFLSAMSLIVIVFMLPMAVKDTAQARIKRRLTTIGHMTHASRSELQSLLKAPVYSNNPWLNNLLCNIPLVQKIGLHLERANLDMSPSVFLLCSGGACVVTFFMFTIVGKPTWMALLFATIALVIPFAYLKYVIWKRLRKFLEQMPDGLEMISQSLQAGQGLTQAMVYVAKEMPDPIGTEFSVFIEEVNLGLPLNDALRKFEQRMSLPEVRLFNTALLVQREIGGSLSELLTKLANIIRDRFRIERLIKSLTAQNRMSAWTVSSIPPFLAVFMFIREPVMMNEMMVHPAGRAMLATALVLEVIGIFVFRKFIKIHI